VISRSSIKLLDCTTALDAKLNGRCVCNVQKHPLPAAAAAVGATRGFGAPFEWNTEFLF
jgi:hypothetical protein